MIDKKLIFVNFNDDETRETLTNKLIEELQILIVSNLNSSDFYNYFAFTGDSCLRLIYKEKDKFSKDLEFVAYGNKDKKRNYESCFNNNRTLFGALGVNNKEELKDESFKTYIFRFDYKNLVERFGLEQYKDFYEENEKLEIEFIMDLRLNKEIEVEVVENDFPLYQVNCVKKEFIKKWGK